MTQLIETYRLLQLIIFDIYFSYRVFEIIPPCQILTFLPNSFILTFNKLESLNVQTFQLIGINFRFDENVNFFVVTLYTFLISRNRIQLNKGCNAHLKSDELIGFKSCSLTLSRMGLFGATHGWGRGRKGPPS